MSSERLQPAAAPHLPAPLPELATVLRGRHIMLTGATGFLGKVVLGILLKWHPEIGRLYLLIRGDRRSSQGRLRREVLDSPALAPLREQMGAAFERYVEEKLTVLGGDLTERALVGADCVQLLPARLDAVINCAGLVNFEASLERALAINALGVANVIEFCRRRQAALLHVSTCYVAGRADGHRFEDALPVNWCPAGQPGFSVKRELAAALAAIAHVEAESRDPARRHEAEPASFESSDSHAAAHVERLRKRWVEQRLKEIGRRRALTWGWPNTYSYSKSLGEQLVFMARQQVRATVARPSIIESALAEPFPGWNQGANTSAPLTYLAGRGYRLYPAESELVLDVLPVDLAAHAMVPVLCALLLGVYAPVYQLCTSDCNPLRMRRLVELTALAYRQAPGAGAGAGARLVARHLEPVIASQPAYELATSTLPALLEAAVGPAQTLLDRHAHFHRPALERLSRFADNTRFAASLVEIYRPYIQELRYTFHGRNIRALYAALRPQDAERHPFRPEAIDWSDYWPKVHIAGLRRHVFGQLDLQRRLRPSAAVRPRTLVELLEKSAERYGARPALVWQPRPAERAALSYRELRDAARRGALLLGARGVRPRERVVLVAENSPWWAVAYFAALQAGAVAVPLDHLISPEEFAAVVRIAEPKAVLLSGAARRRLGSVLASAVAGAVQLELDDLKRPFVVRGKSVLPAVAAERSAPASIVFTSGTTAAPKGVTLSHGNFAAEVVMLSRVFSLGPEDALLSVLPLHHTLEFTCGLLVPLAHGATVFYPGALEARNLGRALADIKPTALIGVPALWEAVQRRIVEQAEGSGALSQALFDELRSLNYRLYQHAGWNLGRLLFRRIHQALGGRLRLAISGGAPLASSVARFFNEIGLPLYEGYGLTEAGPVLTVARPDEPLIPGSVGQPLAGVEIKLLEPDPNGVGEIAARGPNIMAGYYRNQAATEEVLREGWLHTGDLGRLDDDGRLYIVGRAKEVIVDSGGHNIYIDQIEEAYGRSPYIKEMAVAGLKVGDREQAAALVVPSYSRGESRRAVEARVLAHFAKVDQSLTPYKRIRIVRFTDESLPRTRTRKIVRPEVARRLAQMLRAGAPAGGPGASEVEPWLADALKQLSNAAAPINGPTRLVEDLGLDSLALAELAELLAGHTSSEFDPASLVNLSTVEELQAFINHTHAPARLPSYQRFAESYTPMLARPVRQAGEAALRGVRRLVLESWLRPRVLGRGNIPFNRNVLVVANHASHLDFALVEQALYPMRPLVLAARDYFFSTPARRFFALNFTRLVPLDRERAHLESLDAALAELRAGQSVLMFAEGTRSPDGAIHPFKSGAGYLALRGGCDVLPVRLIGTFEALGKGRLIPRRHPVEVRIGRMLSSVELAAAAESAGRGAYRKVSELLRAAVVALGEPARSGAPRPAKATHRVPAASAALAPPAQPLPEGRPRGRRQGGALRRAAAASVVRRDG